MKKLVGALLFGQSGGPSAVINASACGVFEEAFKNEKVITGVYGAAHGIKGILNDVIYDIGKEDRKELALLRNTPSSALGSVRYKLKDAAEDETDYKRILEVFQKHNIRYFFYNGGNDSMDTCNKISKYLQACGYECYIIGVPKTIDNDLAGTDHCPGYGSAAKYVATSCMELSLDSRVYGSGMVTVVEIMGRNAGWLTAASAVASYKGCGPDLIYVPEVAFDCEEFLESVSKIYKERGNCIAAVSEGVRDASGKYISEYSAADAARDSFNHVQLGGVGAYLANLCKEKLGAKTRAIEFSLLQRCAAHIASKTDADEAYRAGAEAVKAALKGKTDIMIGFERDVAPPYRIIIKHVPLSTAANAEKKLPKIYLTDDHHFITREFLDYVTPLITGENPVPYAGGVPVFAKLRKGRLE